MSYSLQIGDSFLFPKDKKLFPKEFGKKATIIHMKDDYFSCVFENPIKGLHYKNIFAKGNVYSKDILKGCEKL